MRSHPRTILFSFFSLLLMLAVGGFSDISAQGKGRGGERGGGNGGGQAQVQRQAPQRQERPQVQRPQPQMRQQAQRQMPQMRQPQQRPQMQQRQMPQMQRSFPQMNRQPQRPQMQRQQPQFQRQMPQMNRQAQPQERPQMQRQQRQMPQWNRGPQRQEQRAQRQPLQVQRQQRPERPQVDRRAQQQNRVNVDRTSVARGQQRVDRQRPNILRMPVERGSGRGSQQDRVAGNQQLRDGGNGRAARFDRQSGGAQSLFRDRGNGRSARDDRQSSDWGSMMQGRGNSRQRGGFADTGILSSQDGSFQDLRSGDGRWGRHQIDPSNVDISGFRDQYQAWQEQAQVEGWQFNDRDFRTNVFEYRQREAWRTDLLRSIINVNIGYPNDYYYIAPPQYPAYYGVNYEPWYYNIGYTYYDPYYSGFYVQPYYMAYQPYDYYYSSYYYDDPYYFDDPYDDYVTYRIFASSNSGVGGFVTRLLGGLLAYGYDQGYRDGLLARQSGYDYADYYYDPYVYYDEPAYTTYTTASYYQPYLYGSYEDRYCLSEGYSLGYQDAFYGEYDDYDPFYDSTNINIVSLYVGTTFQINV